MNNKNNNKRSSIQKVDPKAKVSDDNSTTSKKDFSSKSFVNIVFNKYKILAYSILIIVPFSLVIGSLSFWIYDSNLKQDQILDRLSNQLETMPAPISQGRLGLIIKKSNDGLMLEINKEILSSEASGNEFFKTRVAPLEEYFLTISKSTELCPSFSLSSFTILRKERPELIKVPSRSKRTTLFFGCMNYVIN